MSFKAPHVSFVSFAVEVLPSGITQVMIVETGLHLNPKTLRTIELPSKP
jgi:hypothetical protein